MASSEQLGQRIFHLQMRDHLTADFAEARSAVDDMDETLGIDKSEVAGNVISVVQSMRSPFGIAEVP